MKNVLAQAQERSGHFGVTCVSLEFGVFNAIMNSIIPTALSLAFSEGCVSGGVLGVK